MKTDGGPAFPMPDYLDIEGGRIWGVSKRDWFAAQALTGILWHQINDGRDFLCNDGPMRAASWAYYMADAMIAASSKPEDQP